MDKKAYKSGNHIHVTDIRPGLVDTAMAKGDGLFWVIPVDKVAKQIISAIRKHHPNYTLLSNCLAPRRVIDAVRLYQPRHLYVSLDGGRETYQHMRGRDGYDRVIQVVEA